MKKIKVAHVITRMDWGGSPDIARLICEGLDKDKYDLTFICGESIHATKKTKAFMEKLEDRLIIIPSLKRDINLFYDLIAFFSLCSLFKKEKFDIVHTHTAKAGCLGRLAAKLTNTRAIVHTSHGHNFYGYFGMLMNKFIVVIERWLSTFTDKIITLTKLEKLDLLEFRIVKEEKIVVAHTAVDRQKMMQIDKQKSSLLKKELRIRENNIVVGMVGRLENIKGVRYFLEAALWCAEKFKNVQFVLVGEGSLKNELIEKVKEKRYLDRFIFCGWRDDVTDIMCLMDIMVLASLNEAVGLVLIEAQSLGVPVIATTVGGIPEVVDDGLSGILVKPKDIKALYSAMALLIENDYKRQLMRDATCKFAQNKYDADDLCRIIMKTYDMLLKNDD